MELTVDRDGAQAVIRVRDNGIGIAAADLPRVFEMFAQVDASLERSRGGLGIGLTLAKTLVEMHGGAVDARSDGPGRGSEFVVRLPALSGSQERLPAAAERSSAPAPARRVLIVDDNEDGAESLALLLELSGHETRQARDGMEALEVAEQYRPDVILLDIGLPRLNGYDVCRRIRDVGVGQGSRRRRDDGMGTGRRSRPIAGGGIHDPPGQAGRPRRSPEVHRLPAPGIADGRRLTRSRRDGRGSRINGARMASTLDPCR